MPEVLVSQQQALRNRTTLSYSVLVIAVASLLFSVWATFVGFHHSIFDFHGFRQTQTAITAEYMEHGGPFLRYLTPVFGPPWAIPFEFPFYQKIVALIAEHLRVPLNETGRAVSIAFFYLCFLPLASILKRLRYTPIQVLAVLSLFAVSPIYIFVSRMFMIESTALFFSLMYVDMIFRLVSDHKPWQYRFMFLAALFGSLAGLVKVTTFAAFLLLGSAIGLSQLWKGYRNRTLPLSRAASVVLLAGLVPLSLTIFWTAFTGTVRAQNPLCAEFLHGSAFTSNFGTVAERLQAANYVHLIHAVAGQTGSLRLLFLLALVYAIVVRRWNLASLISLALYVITTMIFFHFHLVHEYYPYASAIFLLVGAGVLIADLLALPGQRAWLGFAFLVAIIVACLIRYHGHFYQIQRTNAPGRPEVAAIIDVTTKPDDVIVISGLDWSSELPYQSNRRTIMEPDYIARNLIASSFPNAPGPIEGAIRNQHADTIPEMVVCGDMRGTSRPQVILQLLGIQPSHALHADDCDIYTRSTN